MSYDHSKYTSDYTRTHYDQIMVKVPKGKKEVLRQLAADKGITDRKGQVSVNRLIIQAVERTYNVDLAGD